MVTPLCIEKATASRLRQPHTHWLLVGRGPGSWWGEGRLSSPLETGCEGSAEATLWLSAGQAVGTAAFAGGGGVGPLWRGIPSTCSCSQALELKPRGTHLFYFFPSGVCVSQSAATKLPATAAPCRGLPGPQHSLTASPPGSGRQGCRLVTEARQGSSKTPSGCTPPRHTRTASLLAPFGVPPASPPSYIPSRSQGAAHRNLVASVTQSCPSADTLGWPNLLAVQVGSRGPARGRRAQAVRGSLLESGPEGRLSSLSGARQGPRPRSQPPAGFPPVPEEGQARAHP